MRVNIDMNKMNAMFYQIHQQETRFSSSQISAGDFQDFFGLSNTSGHEFG